MEKSELLKLRRAASLSQEELARLLDVSVTTVSRWETGKVKISKMNEIAIRQVVTITTS